MTVDRSDDSLFPAARIPTISWGSLMAGALIASLPVAVVYTFFLDRFVAGFTMGAVK